MIRSIRLPLAVIFALRLVAVVHADVVVEKDITYGKADDIELKLDLARPANGGGPFPAIIFIHGGGWAQGSRDGSLGRIQEAARRGYVAVTIDYRLMQFDMNKKETTTATTNFPAQIHDCKAAVRWLRASAEKYRVDKNRIGATGQSAGGHLSLLVGLTDPESGLEGDSGQPGESSRVQAIVNIYGPTDMQSCYEKSSSPWLFRLFAGGTPEQSPALHKLSSPVTHVTKDDPPVLTIHGDRDQLVPIQQAKLLDEKMKAAGASRALIVIKGEGHGFSDQYRDRVEKSRWEFFEEHLKP